MGVAHKSQVIAWVNPYAALISELVKIKYKTEFKFEVQHGIRIYGTPLRAF